MTTSRKARNRSKAYLCGWFDGRYGPTERLTESRRLAEWICASGRLGYYRGSPRRLGGPRSKRRLSRSLLEPPQR